MKFNLLTVFFLSLTIAGFSQNSPMFFVVSNSLNIAQTDKVVAVPWLSLIKKYPKLDTSDLRIINSVTRTEIPFQLEKLGNADVQNLLVQVSVPSKGSVKLLLMKGQHKAFKAKTFGRYVPERKDDFAWENDRIAFRMYGKALEGTNENAYGVDVWVKRTSDMVINDRYKRGNYHMDQGDGMDYYHVGFTLGAGASAPFVKDSIWYSANYTDWKVLDNGPLRTTFQLIYKNWDVDGLNVGAVKTISLDAGSQLSYFKVKYNYEGKSALPVAVGIVKRKEPGIAYLNEQLGILGYWEPRHGEDGITGLGTIICQPVSSMTVRKGQFLSISESKPDGVFEYYSGACWNKAGLYQNETQWFQYLQQFKSQLENPLKVIL